MSLGMRIRSSVASAILAVAGFLALTAHAGAAPPAPLGLDTNGASYALVANNLWTVSVNGSGFVKAKPVVVLATPLPGDRTAFYRQHRAYIWAPACTASKQILKFRRAYFLPGPAKTFAARFFDTIGGPENADNLAIASVAVKINGVVAFKIDGATKTIAKTTGGRFPALFKHGENVVEIDVVKRVQSGTRIGQCRNGSPARPLGIYFEMLGEFEADLWLSPDSYVTTEVFTRNRPGQALQGWRVTVSPLNKGVSGAYTGTLTTHVFASTLKDFIIFDLSVTGRGISNCNVVDLSVFQKRIDCEVRQFQRGAEPRLSFTAGATFHESFQLASISVTELILSPTRDPQGNTNGRRRIRYMCHADATDARCPPKP